MLLDEPFSALDSHLRFKLEREVRHVIREFGKTVVLVNERTFALIQSGVMKKGDVLTVAQIAGVMGAKRTPDIIPMCHPILMDGINLELTLDSERLSVEIKPPFPATAGPAWRWRR